jgi:hypothetical protein
MSCWMKINLTTTRFGSGPSAGRSGGHPGVDELFE